MGVKNVNVILRKEFLMPTILVCISKDVKYIFREKKTNIQLSAIL